MYTLSLHDALPMSLNGKQLERIGISMMPVDAKGSYDERGNQYSFGNRSEEHTSALQSQSTSSHAVFCLKNKTSNRGKKEGTKGNRDIRGNRRGWRPDE